MLMAPYILPFVSYLRVVKQLLTLQLGLNRHVEAGGSGMGLAFNAGAVLSFDHQGLVRVSDHGALVALVWSE